MPNLKREKKVADNKKKKKFKYNKNFRFTWLYIWKLKPIDTIWFIFSIKKRLKKKKKASIGVDQKEKLGLRYVFIIFLKNIVLLSQDTATCLEIKYLNVVNPFHIRKN